MRVLPDPDDETRFYWEAAAREELQILRCGQCRFYVHYPRAECPQCRSKDLAPERVSGRGTVYSYTITHREVPGKATPFALVLVELEEQRGLRVLANLVDCPMDHARVGLPVEVTFEDIGGGITLPQFRPRV